MTPSAPNSACKECRRAYRESEAVEADEADGQSGPLLDRYWLRTGAPHSLTGRKIIEGLDPTDEHEALRRYKAHLDEHERERYAPPPPKCCSFCGEPASDERPCFGSTTYPLICDTCAARAAAVFAEQRKRR